MNLINRVGEWVVGSTQLIMLILGVTQAIGSVNIEDKILAATYLITGTVWMVGSIIIGEINRK